MTKRILAVLALSGFSMGAIAADDAQKSIELKGGQTLYVFKDGRMAVADSLGRPAAVKPGTTVEAKDGQKIVVKSNEVYRLHLASTEPG